MPDSIIAVANGNFRFDLDALLSSVRRQWPRAGFVRATGRIASVSLGQFQIPEPLAQTGMLLVEVDPSGRALDLDSPVDVLVAEFAAWATRQPGFPDDGSVILAEWGPEPVALHPNMTDEDLLAQR